MKLNISLYVMSLLETKGTVPSCHLYSFVGQYVSLQELYRVLVRRVKERKPSKICEDGALIQVLYFWTSPFVQFLSKTPSCFYLKTQCFGDWILSPSSGKTYSVGPNR
jgi:hypothetical protein